MLTGEVKLLKQVRLSDTKFDSLNIGEGTAGTDGTRIKIQHDSYLHFQTDGYICRNHGCNWPVRSNRDVRKFRLIAEEI